MFTLPSHSRFLPIEEKNVFAGSQVVVALDEVGSFSLQNEFNEDAQNFSEELTSTVLSTVVARSEFGQGLSCFCPEFVNGG